MEDNKREVQINDALAWILQNNAKLFEAMVKANMQGLIEFNEQKVNPTAPLFHSIAILSQVLREISVIDDVRLAKITLDGDELEKEFNKVFNIERKIEDDKE